MKHRLLADRFWEKVDKNGPVPSARPDLGVCWMWTGYVTIYGYGQVHVGGRAVHAHRALFNIRGIEIPTGLEPDHLCRNRQCVNPFHIELVTRRENLLRGSGIIARQANQVACVNGHPFGSDHSYIGPSGRRSCRTCKNEARRRKYALANTHRVTNDEACRPLIEQRLAAIRAGEAA